jgi:hypothetical protein
VSDDTPTERFDPTGGSGKPLPKFPWEEGYVAPGTTPVAPPPPTSADVPTQAYTPPPVTPPSNADVPTELFNAQPAQPISPFNPIVIPPAAAPPVTTEATKKFDALPSDDPFGPGGMFAADAFREHPDDLIPAERFVPANVPPPSAPYPSRRAATPPPRNNHTLLWVLGSVAAVLVIVIVVLLMVLFQPKDTPVALPTNTPVQSETPVAPEPSQTAEEPEVVGPTFDSFEAPTSSGCEEGDTEKPLSFSWSSTNAVRAYIGVGTDNARQDPFDGDLPPEYTYDLLTFLCEQESQTYTVTLEDSAGEIASETVTVTR